MITKTQFLLFYSFFIAVVLFFESQIYAWNEENYIYTSNSGGSNLANQQTNSTCYYELPPDPESNVYPNVWKKNIPGCYDFPPDCFYWNYTGDCPVALAMFEENVTIVATEPITFNEITQRVFNIITLGTNDPNLFWLQLILFAPLTFVVGYILATSFIPTLNGGA